MQFANDHHFSRLGFDLYRLHVWDTEISDIKGNLIENEHLDAFDYLLWTLKEKGINYVITPIAFWGNGWPEPDEETPGFSHHYGKNECLTNEEAIKAQQNYLFQFLNHVNPYTGIAYKDDISSVKRFLKELGDPYDVLMLDPKGRAAIDLGLYGVPETYFIDSKGKIKYRQVGPLTVKKFENILKSLKVN